MRVMKWSMIALAVSASTSQFAMASSQEESKGFFEDQSLNVKSRMLYMNRDFKNGASNNQSTANKQRITGYREETGLGVQAVYESGFTQGTVGFGLDALANGMIKLDSGPGRTGNGMFGKDSDGTPEDTQSNAGGAVKFRLSDTVLKYGNQYVASPVFSTDDSRLLPEVATGTLITSKEIKGLELSAGHFTAMRAQNQMGRDSLGLKAADIAGATYQFTDNFVAGVAASDVDDHFKKQYINANYTLPINEDQSLNFDFNGYRSKSQGQELSGDVDNRIWSLAAAYSLGAHKFTLAHQRSTGDTGYVYGVDGGGTIFLSNSVQYSDFNGQDERSWQARYDLNMKSYGVPGLSFMTRYIRGDNITTGDTESKEHEWDFETKYVLQSGPAKDLSFRVRNAVYRANSAYDSDKVDTRLIIEYPLSIL
ncbi:MULTISPECIES: OprD family porin [Pseudomonas]|jgi:imipenem/basic amino acid-specific outer membrane pore|uniref:Imipenem/basic amino acid-specific outer membrane pore n=3 Tax=Pseudomonas fluorescens group TaxID=136843 RepID=A0AB36D2Q4_9PSED|nr:MULTISPECIES: OprD family porin [Pseudomonas]MBU0526110.1 OprD family porin [Gammaproteobacteria bacterium]MDF9879365.1 imipenem/basic amino acid-specific outer membrane pore [Pseudomonas silensiensis]AHZ71944.1 outer membrane porin [Pseudomonas mandelii JR-1]MBU0821382.1 OprD family porin [Gammaproteobacteria bacterium]MBU0843859.1 OprD family porin [Gammaproteobacteria bacterium]